jgi:hypothetical protein
LLAFPHLSAFLIHSDEHSMTDASVADSMDSDDESSLGDSSHEGLTALEMLQASDLAAASIQKQFRNSLARRAPPLKMASSGAAAIALALIGVGAKRQVTFDLPPDVTETTEHEDSTENSEDAEEEVVKPRSGKHLWGIAGTAGLLVGATMAKGLMSSNAPVDEDDVIAAALFFNGTSVNSSGVAAGGGGGGGGYAGGGAGAGGAAAGGGGGGAAGSAQ